MAGSFKIYSLQEDGIHIPTAGTITGGGGGSGATYICDIGVIIIKNSR